MFKLGLWTNFFLFFFFFFVVVVVGYCYVIAIKMWVEFRCGYNCSWLMFEVFPRLVGMVACKNTFGTLLFLIAPLWFTTLVLSMQENPNVTVGEWHSCVALTRYTRTRKKRRTNLVKNVEICLPFSAFRRFFAQAIELSPREAGTML